MSSKPTKDAGAVKVLTPRITTIGFGEIPEGVERLDGVQFKAVWLP